MYNLETANCGDLKEERCREWQADHAKILEAIESLAEEKGWDGEGYFMDFSVYPGATITRDENMRIQARNAQKGEQHIAFRFRKQLGGKQYTLTVNHNSPTSVVHLPFVMLEKDIGLASHRGALYSQYSNDHSQENLARLLAEAARTI